MSRKRQDPNAPTSQNPLWKIELPLMIEPEWDDRWGPLLAGFPLELVYSSEGLSGNNKGTSTVRKARYLLDLGTFFEDQARKQMHYFPRLPSEYYVIVKWDKAAQIWTTDKFRGDRLVVKATGRTFKQAMIHTLLVGLQPDEPAD